MGGQLVIDPGEAPQVATTSGSGATEAADLAALAPAADAHKCLIQRPFVECQSAGFAIRITDRGSLGDGLTLGVSTMVGSLKVRNIDTGQDMSDDLPVCDHTIGNLGAGVGTVLFMHGITKAARAQPGQEVALVWNQVGLPLDGAVPQFQILRCALVSIDGARL